ncbi:MAG: Site-specific recombinase, partial [Parcubacteria group bacterium Athens0416_74]
MDLKIQQKNKKKVSNKPDYKKAIIYTRVSSESQATDGNGLRSQEQRCREYARQRGYIVEKVFHETFTGGGDFTERPEMTELLRYLDERAHTNYVVIFDDLKRLARDTKAHIQLRMEFNARGAKPESPNFNFDGTPEGEFVETVFAAQGELERKQNRRQVIQKMRARLETGYWPFAARKGYRMVTEAGRGKLAVPSKEGLTILKPALELFATGALLRKIDVCKYLVDRGFWKKRPPECYIENLTLILKDPFYCGDIAYPAWGVTRRKGQHTGLISKVIFEQIQKRLKIGVGKRRYTKISADFPMRGLVICPNCRHQLTAAWSQGNTKRYPYYFCQHDGCTLANKAIGRDSLEDDFAALLRKQRFRPDALSVLSAVFESAWNEEIKSLEWHKALHKQKHTDLVKKVRELSDLVRSAKSETLKRAYESQIEDAAKELEQIETLPTEMDTSIPYQTALEKVKGLLHEPYFAWQNATLD